MDTALIHLSDIHYRQGWAEEQDVVLATFFDDLQRQVEKIQNSNVYLVLSGDVVQAGRNDKLYEDFLLQFDSKLNSLNLTKNRRICVPGNHDVSAAVIAPKLVEHEGVVCQNLNEKSFNDYVATSSNMFKDKFPNYEAFVSTFAQYGLSREAGITGAGWEIEDNIGVYCLNSALCSSAALELDSKKLLDKERLAIDTRSLCSWVLTCKARQKVLVMHHPLDWLTEWARRELATILAKDFALCLSGHSHDQAAHHSIHTGKSLVECSAPPLFTKKDGDLGYSIIKVNSDKGVVDIAYRQWNRHHSFVAGVNFSNTDDGTVSVAPAADSTHQSGVDFITRYLVKRLDEALVSFSSQPRVWVEPLLRKVPEVTTDTKIGDPVSLSDLITTPKSTIIKAPPQFGLTCLAHYLILEAWRKHHFLWLYLDARSLKPHVGPIQEAVDAELQLLGSSMQDVKCVVLDSWTGDDKYSYKLLEKLSSAFTSVPIFVMHTVNTIQLLGTNLELKVDRTFEPLYLWALPRAHVRELVADYNQARYVGDEDAVTTKITADLEMLNIHRTPLNCLTLLKVSEVAFEESPVNRTEMIKRVLFLLFNVDEIPTYKARPDLNDCEYVLGYFCETILREEKYLYFTREYFLTVIANFCKTRLIDLEVQVVFDVLHANNIIVKWDNLFHFKFAYWIYYFAAQRMHQDETFAQFIFEDMRYARYPEIIEFYTGIDRRREDALRILITDVRACGDRVQAKTGLPIGFNPYRFAQWRASPDMLKQMEAEINDGVSGSNLPATIKDHYADRSYNPARPYRQEIFDILSEHSFVFMFSTMKAAAKALRNSDYVDPVVRRELLEEISRCWEEASKVLMVVLPPLAVHGHALFGGVMFYVDRADFGDTVEDRFRNILLDSGGPKELDRERGVLSEALRGSRYAASRWGSRAK